MVCSTLTILLCIVHSLKMTGTASIMDLDFQLRLILHELNAGIFAVGFAWRSCHQFVMHVLTSAGTEITGVCRNRGAVGGLQALTALESYFARVSLQALPAQGGFHAAYTGMYLMAEEWPVQETNVQN